MKLLRILCIFLTGSLLGLTACGSGGSGGEDPLPTSTTTPTTTTNTITLSTQDLTLGSESNTATLNFTTDGDWKASSNQSWCKVTPTSGSKGSFSLTITCEENTTYDERNATVTIKCGTVSKNITVTQKQKDALLITSNKVEMTAEGGDAKIEVKANISYEASVEEAAQSWISIVSTRALATYNVAVKIAENTTGQSREGKVTISSGNQKEVVTVYQQGNNPSIVLTQEEVTVSSEGETVKVELQSNVNVSVKMPNVTWITQATTRAMSSYTYYFTVAKNEGYDSRSAEIEFVNTDNNLSKKVKINQMQNTALNITQKSFTVGEAGGSISVEIKTNLAYTISSDVSWITDSSTRGLTTYTHSFKVAALPSDAETRTGTITVTRSDNSQKEQITVTQTRANSKTGYGSSADESKYQNNGIQNGNGITW